jgi:prefoldin subunit 5
LIAAFSSGVLETSVIQDRLSVITDTITSLDTQMRELERLRDQVKNAEQLVRKSERFSPARRRYVARSKVVSSLDKARAF